MRFPCARGCPPPHPTLLSAARSKTWGKRSRVPLSAVLRSAKLAAPLAFVPQAPALEIQPDSVRAPGIASPAVPQSARRCTPGLRRPLRETAPFRWTTRKTGIDWGGSLLVYFRSERVLEKRELFSK